MQRDTDHQSAACCHVSCVHWQATSPDTVCRIIMQAILLLLLLCLQDELFCVWLAASCSGIHHRMPRDWSSARLSIAMLPELSEHCTIVLSDMLQWESAQDAP